MFHCQKIVSMKVLKKGRQQRGWAKEYLCSGDGNQGGGCGALLLVEQSDLFQTTSHCRDETTYYVTFKCPECGVLTDIKEKLNFTIPSQRVWENRKNEVDLTDII